MMQDVFEKLQYDSENREVLIQYDGFEIRVRDPITEIFNGEFKSHDDDCLPVAISLFFNRPYEEVYRELADEAISQRAILNKHEIAKRYLTGMGLQYYDGDENDPVSLWDLIMNNRNWFYHSNSLFLTSDHAFVVRDGIIYTPLNNDSSRTLVALSNAFKTIFKTLYGVYSWPADHYV